MSERTYELVISCDLYEVQDGVKNAIQKVTLEELDLNYEQVLGLQEATLLPLVTNLLELGKMNLKSKQ